MLLHVSFAASIVFTSLLFALLEIEIEGTEGWARRLPTWRISSRWTRLLFGARAITGYHLYSQLFLVTVLHLPYALGLVEPSWRAELRILSFLLLFWVVEDFLWFVVNPAYGIRRFRPEHIWWHAPNWWWIMPRDYWLFIPLGITLYILSQP